MLVFPFFLLGFHPKRNGFARGGGVAFSLCLVAKRALFVSRIATFECVFLGRKELPGFHGCEVDPLAVCPL